MADRTLPPQVEGPSQGRLDMIVGRPSLFPAPKATQTFVFTFRWWGDTRPCVLRLPPNKSEVRIVYHITCSPRSFRQYLLDAGSLHVSLRIEGSGKLHDMEEDHHLNNELQNLKKSGNETPRQKLLRRQLRLKKGWQDGDVVGSFMLPDMKLNTRGDYVRECRIVDSSADIVGTIVVTLVFLEGSLDDFHHLKISNDEETSPNDKSNETKPKSRPSGIPVRDAHTSKIPKNVNEGYRPRSRSSSFRSSPRPKSDPLKSPRKQPGEHLFQGYQGKENEAPPRMREAKGSQPVESQEPQVVLRRGRGENQSLIRERPASWGLYPLLNGADPCSLVESGAVKKEDLPILMQVLEGRSPSLDLSNLDPDTQKLLEGLDLSMSFSGISTTSSGRSFSRGETSGREKQGEKPRSQGFSVFKGNEQDGISFSGVSMTSGVWPLERVEESQANKTVLQERAQPHVSPRAARRLSQAGSAKSKIPMSHAGSKSPGTACRSLLSRPTADRSNSSMTREASFTSKDEEELSEIQENGPLGRRSSDGPSTRRGSEEGSVLVVDVGTLTLAPSLLPARPPDKQEKISGVKVMHRSRVCYLTTLEVKLPGVEIPPEWDLSQTCASRQLLDNEINYNIREVLKLPPAPALEILRGQLEIRSVCRRLGERDSEEVGSASVSMMDLWQLSGSEVQVPLFRSEVPDGKDSLTKRRKAKRKEEGDVKQSYANLTFTARLGLAVGQSHHAGELEEPWELHHRKGSHEVGSHVGHPDSKPREIPYLSKLREKGYTHALPSTPPPHSGPRSHRDPDGEDREVIRIFKPRPVPPESYEPFQSAVFNSIYLPTHMSPRDKIYNGSWQQQPKQLGRVEVVDNILSSPVPTKVVNDAGFRIYQGSFLAGINGHEPQTNNQPIESGGESPCIRTIGDFHADYIEHALLNRRSSAEMKQEEKRGSCRVHLEILKGRNLPWVEGTDGTLKPPSCYVRATIGSHNIQTNICLEADNPMWNYAADVLLPYSQLCQTDGNLILKVHHGSWDQPPSLEDPLMGFVCVDATSIWSGHVSLCGWYPLLDLRGCVRGHLKVSLTPHEPPQAGGPPRKACYSVNLHENVGQKVMAETYRSGATYSQRSDKSGDAGLRESQSHVASDSESSKRESLKPLSPNILQKHSPKSQRKKYSSGSDGSVSDASSSPYKNVESSSVYSKYSVISSGSVVVDGEVLNDVSGFHGGVSGKKSSSPRETLHSTTGVENRTSYDRKYSSIPVFSPHKDSNKLADQENERRKASDNLPEVSYREKENKTPSTSVHSQGFCRHKGTVIVKGIATDSDKVSGSGAGSRGSEDSDHGTPKMERRKGSILLKDSLIVSHFRMQKEEDSNKETASQENILPTQVPSSPRFGDKERTSMSKEGHELQSQPSQPPVSTSGTSTTVDKPSSCLKVPGSPSLRAKHVTFAHKLVQHQDRDGSSDQNRRQSGLTQQSQDLYRTGHETFGNAGIDRNILDSESRQKSPRGHVPTERSDLQVVPCREGDTQVVTTTVSAQGSRSYSVVSGFDSKGMMEARKSRDNRSDLIMAFSWMNQSSGSDTPCVSFIEQRQNAKEGESVGKSHHVNNSADNKGSPDMGNHTGSPQKKSRKFRNRLAANFHLK
ncbi:uncharacterized protein LOC122263338 isoform X2 [Penaeus japonicus]|uniref:uncharacterized protein LOC122263338 isoform X2 n=1 Tax=Penaeus japonicus TaxID=27405 RepID=UPI001C70C0E4|nr:uncharacterized protein LOC122263338 isoform X2 [Penaeus japonicus]